MVSAFPFGALLGHNDTKLLLLFYVLLLLNCPSLYRLCLAAEESRIGDFNFDTKQLV